MFPISAKRRRAEANFPGAAAILAALRSGGHQRRRVGLRMEPGSGPPARHGVPIVDSKTGTAVGHVTSGCPSPTLGGCVAMGYVAWNASDPAAGQRLMTAGTAVQLDIRGRQYSAQVQRMPFVAARYHAKAK